MSWRERALREQIWKQAATWYARMEEPGSEAEVAAFEAWLAERPEHAQAYAEMEGVSRAAGRVRRSAAEGRRRTAGSGVLRPALTIGLFALAVVAGLWLWQSSASPAFAAVSNEGPAVRGVRLADGTGVWLDAGAEIGVSRNRDLRSIEVRKGRVRFDPGADSRPLVVLAGGLRIPSAASRFDVGVDGGHTTVGALDGQLALEGGPGFTPMRLTRGQAVAVGRTGTRPATLDRTWPASRLRFDRVPLGRIVAIANRNGDPDIAFADADIAALTVSGVLDLRDTRRLARKLAAACDLRVVDERSPLMLRR